MKLLSTVALIIFICSFPVVVFLSSTYFVINPVFFTYELSKSNVSERVPDADRIASNILAYFNHKQELNTSLFTTREATHLQDVRNLLRTLRSALVIALLAVVISIAFLFHHSKKSGAGALFLSSTVTLSIACLFVTLLLFFEGTFDFFHSVFFAPGTYLFLEDSVLIQLFPVGFFQEAFGTMIIISGLTSTLLLIFAVAYRRKI